MKNRWAGWAGLGLAVIVGVALVIPTSHFFLLGRLRREAFYQGQPTSYWISALKKDPFLWGQAPVRDVAHYLAEGGLDAVPVLAEMLRDGDLDVRREALLALGGPQGKAAVPALMSVVRTEENEALLRQELQLLVRWDPHAAASVVMGMLKEPPGPIRERGANILGEFGSDTGPGRPPLALGAEAVAPLEEALEDSDPYIRALVARALWLINGQTGPILPPLLDGIKSENPEVGEHACLTLCMIGPKAEAIVPSLLETLQAEDGSVRRRTLRAVSEIAARRTSVPVLIGALKDEAVGVRQEAADELGFLKARDAVPPLLPALRDSAPEVRQAAIRALQRMDAKEALPALIEALKDPLPELRLTGIRALDRMKAKEAIPALILALNDEAVEIRRAAVATLGNLEAREAVRALSDALKDEDFQVRQAAVSALGRTQVQEAVPALSAALTDNDVRVRQAAVVALLVHMPASSGREAVPALIRALKDQDVVVRAGAASILGRLAAKEAAGELKAALKDEVAEVRQHAALALAAIAPGDGVPALLNILNDGQLGSAADYPLGPGSFLDPNSFKLPRVLTEKVTKSDVIRTLGEMGPAAKSAVPAVTAALKDPDPEVRIAAAVSLWQIDHQTETPSRVLRELLKGGEDAAHPPAGQGMAPAPWGYAELAGSAYLRLVAAQALCRIDPGAGFPILCRMIEKKTDPEWEQAIFLAGELGRAAEPAVPALIKALQEQDTRIRILSAKALGKIGPPARAAVPALVKAAKENDRDVREAASEALRIINPPK